MYLKNLSLRGFKSFADKTTLELEPSPFMTAIVGPNGCGKSNIIDSIRFVIGEQSAKELRGDELEHLIFAGTNMRNPLSMADVSILLDNSDFKLKTEYSEVLIKRRIFRSGESEFYINKNACRLKDIRELFLDSGIGDGGYSIIGQGQVDSIISSKPLDRRTIFEEAAGIQKYKFRKRASERCLIATEQNLLRISDLKEEIKNSLDVLEKQAESAIKYKNLREKLKLLEVGMAKKQLKNINEKREDVLKKIEELKSKTSGSLNFYLKEEEEAAELKNAIRGLDDKIELLRNEIDAAKTKSQESKTKISVENERIVQLEERLEILKIEKQKEGTALQSKKDKLDNKNNELRNYKEKNTESHGYLKLAQSALEEINNKISESITGWNSLKNPIYERDMEVSSNKHSIAEIELTIKFKKETLSKDSAFLDNLKGLKEDIAILENDVMALESVDEDLKKRISHRKSAIDEKIEIEIAFIEKNISSQKTELEKMEEGKSLKIASLKELENDMGEMNKQYEALEKKMNELSKEKEKAIAGLAESRIAYSNYEENYRQKISGLDDLRSEFEESKSAFENKDEEINNISMRIAEAMKQIDETIKKAPELDDKVDTLAKLIDEKVNGKLKKQVQLENLENKIKEASSEDRSYRDLLAKEEIALAKVDGEIDLIRSLMENEYQMGIKDIEEFEAPQIGGISSVKNEIGEIKKEINEIGPVNLLADKEFEEQKGRFSFIENQYKDLISARDNLNSLIRELDAVAKEKFLEAIAIINGHFVRLFGTLFEGGDAKISIEDGDPLEAGIEIIAKPSGKKWINLSLMSGGEKSLTALAILFSLLKTTPSPFCFMDEVDAALDEINTLRFTKMLKEFSPATQIIVITHSKRTMSAVNALYGVTMEEPGISKIVSMKLVRVAD